MSEKEAMKCLDPNKSISVGDLFCGMGGWSEGLRQFNTKKDSPFKIVWAVDMWDRACGVHMHNHPNVDVITSNILDLDPQSLDPVDVIVGSPPCPPFSSAKQWQKKDPKKGLELIETFFKIVKFMKPKAWVMENVRTFKGYIPFIKNLPDDARHFIICGTDYGVPQKRYRCVLTNIDDPRKKPTDLDLAHVIFSLGLPGEEQPSRIFNVYSGPEDVSMTPGVVDGKTVDRHDLYEVKEGHIEKLYRKKRLKKGAGRVPFPDPLDQPARTIVAKPSPIGREPIVIEDSRYSPYKLRYLSLREQAIIQGFPPNYKLSDSAKGHTQVMVGNAFPPPMVRSLAYPIWRKVMRI